MKPRQIKKNSKSAMDLLIKVFGFKQHDFFIELENKTDVWQCVLSTGDSYSDFGGWWENSLTALASQYHFQGSEFISIWDELNQCDQTKVIYKNEYLTGITLIKECRQLAKSGVKFR